ncbi:MAG: transposase [Promethearchaeota archaeon]
MIFFFGGFRKDWCGPDADARIRYCTSKKLAYIGYKCHLLCSAEDMTVLNFDITPANRHDSQMCIPIVIQACSTHLKTLIKKLYGDNAYDIERNRTFLEEHHIRVLFHTKEETGKHPKNPVSAKKKSKKRSRVEALFGISQENLGFGRVNVRGLGRVFIDTAIIFSGWNFGILYSYFINQFKDRISLKRLLYKS